MRNRILNALTRFLPFKPSRARYAERLRQEIAGYREVENVHDLPAIFHVWSHEFIRPRIEEVFGVSTVEPFYVKYILRYAAEHPSETTRIASIGAGNGDLEVRIATQLRDAGLEPFQFQCLDINPAMLARGREAARQERLSDKFEFLETDIVGWKPTEPLGVVMAHHSLHHIVALEEVFAAVKNAIGSDGYFLVWDMIGRNGHMRWPEALSVVEEIWRTMPDRYKFNHQTRRLETRYKNFDCSLEGFEGIRAQDILPLLTAQFHFEGFVAEGNIPDIFIDRGFGHNMDPSNAEDATFVRRLGELNDKLIDEGTIKPTQMIGVMRGRPTDACDHHRHWTPEYCVRWPKRKPAGAGAKDTRT